MINIHPIGTRVRTKLVGLATIVGTTVVQRTHLHPVRKRRTYRGPFKYQYDDAGRTTAGFGQDKADCVVRAIALAENADYTTTRQLILDYCQRPEERHKYERRKTFRCSGIFFDTHTAFLAYLGWRFVRASSYAQVPLTGRVILYQSRHLTVAIDGTMYDQFDPRRKKLRGYYVKPAVTAK